MVEEEAVVGTMWISGGDKTSIKSELFVLELIINNAK
jgi:hypothetical protein